MCNRNKEDVEKILSMLAEASDIDLSDDDGNSAMPRDQDSLFEKEDGEEVEKEEEEDDDDEYINEAQPESTVTKKVNMKWRRKSFGSNISSFESTEEDLVGPPQNTLFYFEKYITDEVFEEMAKYTNMYALQNNNGRFKEANSAELKTLFGLHIGMETIKYPRVRMHWDNSFGIPLFRENMTRDRFFQLRTNLHIVNNLEDQTTNDRLYKVRPIYDSIRARCLELKKEENLCIDEQIVPFRRQLAFKQYIKGKPIPWGIKIFVLCGASGKMYDFIIYQGSTTGISQENIKNYGFGASVVLHLTLSRTVT